MSAMPSSTWFTAPPEWGWLAVAYYFFGGLAAGCYVIAAIAGLVGGREMRPLVRAGFLTVLPCLFISGIVLIFDLSRPDRFWHLMLQSNTMAPMFKYWSPMSTGSWALLIFGMFSLFSFVSALAEGGHIRWRWVDRFFAMRRLWQVIAVLGALAALYIGGYTGVLLAVTNRPFWSDTAMVGMLMLVSAVSISCAYLLLLSLWRGWTAQAKRALSRMAPWTTTLELLVVVGLLASLGAANAIWVGRWGVLLAIAVLIGMLLPLFMHLRSRNNPRGFAIAAVLVLAGGLLLRTVIVFSQRGIEPWIASY